MYIMRLKVISSFLNIQVIVHWFCVRVKSIVFRGGEVQSNQFFTLRQALIGTSSCWHRNKLTVCSSLRLITHTHFGRFHPHDTNRVECI